jgi:hypothetical protein
VINGKASSMITLAEDNNETILRSLIAPIPELYVKKIIKSILEQKDVKQHRSLSMQLVEEYKKGIQYPPQLPQVIQQQRPILIFPSKKCLKTDSESETNTAADSADILPKDENENSPKNRMFDSFPHVIRNPESFKMAK